MIAEDFPSWEGAYKITPMELVVRQSGATGTGLLPQDRKEIQAAVEDAGIHKEQLNQLSNDFRSRGSFRLFWDRKVPNQDWRFWYFFTFKSSNKEDVIAEITKYLDFYTEMGTVAQKIEDHEEGKAQEVNLLTVQLLNNVKKLKRAAEEGMNTTSSKTVCELHSEMVKNHDKLKMTIMQMEYISRYEAANEKAESLQQQLKESCQSHSDVCNKYDVVNAANNELREDQRRLEADNERLDREDQSHREEKTRMERQLLLLEQQNEALRENNRLQLLLQERQNEEFREQKINNEQQLLLLKVQNEELTNQKIMILQKNEEFKQSLEAVHEVLKLVAKQNSENKK